MTRRRKLRNVRYRQWVRYLRYLDELPIGARRRVPTSWWPRERWQR